MNKILIILPNNPGDVIMGLSVVTRLHEIHPAADIDFIAGSECAQLVEHHPYLRHILIIPSDKMRSAWESDNIHLVLELVQNFTTELIQEKYDLSANLFQEKFGAIIQGLIRADKKIGYTFNNLSTFKVQNRYMEHLFAVPAERSRNSWHVIDIFLKSLGIDSKTQPKAVLPPLPAGSEKVNTIPPGSIVLQMGAAWIGKRWPLSKWIELTSLLLPHSKALVFTGAPEEISLFEQLINKIPADIQKAYPGQIINMIGKTSLLETFHIINKSSMLITGDTVAMHMGAAGGATVIALFGASNPVETGPYGKGNFIIQNQIEVGENLLLKEPCEGLSKITPEEIAAFAINGTIPKNHFTWETSWDHKLKIQILYNHIQEPHPFQINAVYLTNALNDSNQKIIEPDMLIKSLIAQLDICLLSADKKNLTRLSRLDKKLAGSFQKSLIWEAYRININGISMSDIRDYLIKRKKRLMKTLSELKCLNII